MFTFSYIPAYLKSYSGAHVFLHEIYFFTFNLCSVPTSFVKLMISLDLKNLSGVAQTISL